MNKFIFLALLLAGCSKPALQCPAPEKTSCEIPPEIAAFKHICNLEKPEYVPLPPEVKGGDDDTVCFDRLQYVYYALSRASYIFYAGDIARQCIEVNHGR